MYLCMCIHIHMEYVCIYVCVCVYIYIYIYVCIHICIHVSISLPSEIQRLSWVEDACLKVQLKCCLAILEATAGTVDDVNPALP